MSELLPLNWLLKMSIYNVEFGSDKVITRVVNRRDILSSGISELRSELLTLPVPCRIVGIDVVNNGDLVLLYVKNRCLIVQLKRMMALNYLSQVPDSLLNFLGDTNITYVGTKPEIISFTYASKKFVVGTAVKDIGYLAAQILKKPNLLTGKLEELIVEAGLDIKRPIIHNGGMGANWHSRSVLSDEEVKYAMYEVYSCYQIVSKLIHMIGICECGQ